MAAALVTHQLQRRFPSAFWHGSAAQRELALTFDDGPSRSETFDLLATLDRLAVQATFFHVGERAARAPDLVQAVAAAGHQIGLHGYRHQSFLLKSRAKLLADLAKAQQVLAEASGQETAAFTAVRPPYGHFTASILETLMITGYLPAMWSLVPFHWLQSLDSTVREVQKGVYSGAILVLHEGQPGPAAAEIVQALLPQLIAEGYSFVTVNQMWANLQRERTD
jgi:peptidoglycan/xylan/chitin deacetylase (PgdA/CDA1 family)